MDLKPDRICRTCKQWREIPRLADGVNPTPGECGCGITGFNQIFRRTSPEFGCIKWEEVKDDPVKAHFCCKGCWSLVIGAEPSVLSRRWQLCAECTDKRLDKLAELIKKA